MEMSVSPAEVMFLLGAGMVAVVAFLIIARYIFLFIDEMVDRVVKINYWSDGDFFEFMEMLIAGGITFGIFGVIALIIF